MKVITLNNFIPHVPLKEAQTISVCFPHTGKTEPPDPIICVGQVGLSNHLGLAQY